MIHLFDCIVCERSVTDYPDRNGRDRHIAPICNNCERGYGDRGPTAGNFMDRRNAVRLSAIANALHNRASCLNWERRHGRA